MSAQAFGNCPDPLLVDTDLDGLDDGLELLGGLDPCDADYDKDGLPDGQELLVYSTDPTNPDTDGDGLSDGTEVDISLGAGCPSPLVADSDGDTLRDDEEVALGTNPCNPDSDGDGLSDSLDPTPLDPEITTGVLEDVTRTLCAAIEALDLGEIDAPNEESARGRRNSLASRCRTAANALAKANPSAAVALLTSVFERMDGASPPSDWVLDSPDRTSLAADIADLLDLLAGF